MTTDWKETKETVEFNENTKKMRKSLEERINSHIDFCQKELEEGIRTNSKVDILSVAISQGLTALSVLSNKCIDKDDNSTIGVI